MLSPWWRKSSKTWVVTLPGGKLRTLGKDPYGGDRKHPPREIQDAWHRLADEKETKDRPFAEVADAYVKSLEGCTPKTIKNTREHIEWFKTHVGTLRVSELRADDIHAYLKKKNWAESTKATAVAKIVAALNFGVDSEMTGPHLVRFPKKSRRRKPRFERRRDIVTSEEQDILIERANPFLRTLLIGLRESGCRPGELCSARIEKLDLKKGVLTIENKTEAQTGEKWRDVYLSGPLKELIVTLVGNRTSGFIWLNKGKPFTPEVRQAVERAGDEPVRVEDPTTNRSFVLISAEQFERMKALLDPVEQMAPLLNESFGELWNDPALDVYTDPRK